VPPPPIPATRAPDAIRHSPEAIAVPAKGVRSRSR
jgi:hypothetical protein